MIYYGSLDCESFVDLNCESKIFLYPAEGSRCGVIVAGKVWSANQKIGYRSHLSDIKYLDNFSEVWDLVSKLYHIEVLL